VFFFNEINRARPQVHALLLRLMAERSVTAFNTETDLPHLLVFADRNRMERDETFELPAAARDRFFMEISVNIPADADARRRLIFDTRYHDADALVASVPPAILDYRNHRAPHSGRDSHQPAPRNLSAGDLGRHPRPRRRGRGAERR
jgi:MoxR-like ATPase